MKTRLIIEGNAVYEIDEECMECRRKEMKKHELPDAGNPDSCYTVSRKTKENRKKENW